MPSPGASRAEFGGEETVIANRGSLFSDHIFLDRVEVAIEMRLLINQRVSPYLEINSRKNGSFQPQACSRRFGGEVVASKTLRVRRGPQGSDWRSLDVSDESFSRAGVVVAKSISCASRGGAAGGYNRARRAADHR